MISLSYDPRTNSKISIVKDHNLSFNGIIKWERGQNSIMWQSSRVGKEYKAIFGQGDKASAQRSLSAIRAFVNDRSRREQYLLFEKQLNRLWDALASHFGLPVLEII